LHKQDHGYDGAYHTIGGAAMTEREQKARGPTNKAILEAVENLALAYHQFASALQAREDADRNERRYLRDRIDQLFGQVDAVQRKVDRQLDRRDTEFDAFREDVERRLAALEGHNDASDEARPPGP
jgi:hypothetical protein